MLDASKSKSTEAAEEEAGGPAKGEDTASAPFSAASKLLATARRLDIAVLIAMTRREWALG